MCSEARKRTPATPASGPGVPTPRGLAVVAGPRRAGALMRVSGGVPLPPPGLSPHGRIEGTLRGVERVTLGVDRFLGRGESLLGQPQVQVSSRSTNPLPGGERVTPIGTHRQRRRVHA